MDTPGTNVSCFIPWNIYGCGSILFYSVNIFFSFLSEAKVHSNGNPGKPDALEEQVECPWVPKRDPLESLQCPYSLQSEWIEIKKLRTGHAITMIIYC